MKYSEVLIACAFFFTFSIYESAALFEAILTQFDQLVKNSLVMDIDKVKLIRFNRTTLVMNGSFELFVDSIDDLNGFCNLHKKGGNEYKLLPYKIGPSNVCKILLEDEMFYKYFHAYTENFPELNTCDFKRGTYYIKNYLPDVSNVPPVFQSGDYMIECMVYREEELVQGFKCYGQLYNIPSANPIGSKYS